MQYIIETTDYGCIEYLRIDGKTYTKRTQRTGYGSASLDDGFADRLDEVRFDNATIDKIYNLFDGFLASNFMEIAESIVNKEE